MKVWPTVKLRDVLSLDLHKDFVDAAKRYEMVGVLSFGKGLFPREAIENGNTSYKYFLQLKPEHIVMSQLFGWEGALALSSEEFSGRYVSPMFPTFVCDESRINRQFIGWVMRQPTFWNDLGSRAKGMGDRRRTLNPDSLFESTTPLPSLDEQHAIVARLDALAEKTQQLEAHLDAVERDSLRLLVTMATRRDFSDDQRLAAGWREVALASIAKIALDPVTVNPTQTYPNIGIYSYARGLFEKPPIDGIATSAKTLYRIKAGQFIYSRLFAFEGAYALVGSSFDGSYVSNEFPTFDVDLEVATAKFVMTLFLTEQDWHGLRAASKGVGDRRLRIQPQDILARKIWLPPPEKMARIDRLYDGHFALKAKHAAIRAANAALLPATLERVFSEPA